MDYEAAGIEERFFSKVQKRDGCWGWTGAKLKKGGRAVFCVNGVNSTAARVSWFLHNGEWPPQKLFVCHSCDNPECTNPDHLWLGTNRDNLRDAAAKGRIPGQKKTHCVRGHELSADNVRLYRGKRHCKACQVINKRKSANRFRPSRPANWFCCRATWGGFHVWEEGTAKLISWGACPRTAWENALAALKETK